VTTQGLDDAGDAPDAVSLAIAAASRMLSARCGLQVQSSEPLVGGRSAQTLKLRLAGPGGSLVRAVLHVEPSSGPHAGITSARGQAELLDVLAATDAPVPKVLCASDPDAMSGERFLVTGWIDGEVPDLFRSEARAFIAAAEAREPGALAEDFVRVLVAIHRVPVASLPDSALPGAGEPGSAAQRELARWVPGIEASARFAADPVLRYAREWLQVNEPPASPPTLVHGDYRMGNLVLAEGRIAAVLDWELARVGDPLLDVATVCAPPLRAGGLAAGLWESAAFAARYGELTGRPVDPFALNYYRVMATFKVAALWVRASEQFASGAADVASLRAGFSVLETRRMVAETLELEGTPSDSRPPGPAAYEALRETLRDAILPYVANPAARETLMSVRSVLRNMAAAPDAEEVRQFDEQVTRVLAGLHDNLPRLVTAPGPATAATVGERLSGAVRAAFARFGRDTHGEPALAPLRELIGRAAQLPMGMWP
jgi:aminoglycoside phosphotransferase (APT) family kinase protein